MSYAHEIDRLRRSIRGGRFSHACFFACEDDSLAMDAVNVAASELLCTDIDRLPVSPGFICLGDEPIKVDDICALIEETNKCSVDGGNRVVCIKKAGEMPELVQNKLLKTLEEPIPGNFFLFYGKEDGLLPTVRSRLMRFSLPSMTVDELYALLLKNGAESDTAKRLCYLADGKKSQAVRLLNDADYREFFDGVLAFAKETAGLSPQIPSLGDICKTSGETNDALSIMLLLYGDVLRFQLGVPLLVFEPEKKLVALLAGKLSTKHVASSIDAITKAAKRLKLNINRDQVLYTMAIEATAPIKR